MRRFGRLWCRARSGSTGLRRRFRSKFRRRFRKKFRRRSGRLRCRAMSTRFNRVLEKVPVKVWEALEKVPVKVWEALVQSQVMFNRVPEKVPEKVCNLPVKEKSLLRQGVCGGNI